jgi:hypothetical protein
MSSDTDIRRAYSRVTDDASSGPDLAEVLARGRGARRRRTRLRVAGAAGVAAAVVAAGVLVPRSSGTDDVVVVPAGPPAATDFVAGTTVDETMAEVVASHLPALGQPRDVFPSDTDHNGPMPDADFARAEDWQAEYDLPGGDLFRLLVAHPAGGSAYGCPSCTWSDVPGGRVSIEVSQRLATDGSVDWRFLVTFASDSGFLVAALEEVGASTKSGAEAARTFTDAELLALAQDPQLTFPAPAR